MPFPGDLLRLLTDSGRRGTESTGDDRTRRLTLRVRMAATDVDREQAPGRWPPPAARRGPLPVAPDVHALTLGRGTPASNVYLVRTGHSWVLIDAGWAGDADEIRRAAESLFGPGTRPSAILLTHIHPDHSAAAGDLARTWQVSVYVHPHELPMAAGRYRPDFDMPLDRLVIMPVMRLLPARMRSRIEAAGDIRDVTRPLDPDGVVPGLPGWEWVGAPGHTPGSVAYRRLVDDVLVSGDAIVTVDLESVSGLLRGRPRLAGPPWYTTWNRSTARRSVATLAATNPRVLLPGHGYPLTVGTAGALRSWVRGEAGRPTRLDRVLVPVGNPGAGRYRPPPWLYARLQWLGHALTALGLSPGYVVTLEVPGRRSGATRRTNLVRAEHDGQGYLVSLTGESEWVRNVRANRGRVVLARGGVRRAATLVEVPAAQRAPVIRSYVLRAARRTGSTSVAREARAFFGVGPDLAPEEITAVADRFPTFRIVSDPADAPTDSCGRWVHGAGGR